MNKKEIIKKIIIFTFFFSLIFFVVYMTKDNIKKHEQINETIETLFKNWHESDMEQVYAIANVNEDEQQVFSFTTGFENNEVITDIVNQHVYEGPEYSVNDIVIEGIGKKKAEASVAIEVKTYNNLEILDVIIQELLNDNTKVTKDYQQDEFIKNNEKNITDAVSSIEKNSIKTLAIYMQYQDGKWNIPYENNVDFYNALMGGMISLESVDTDVAI